MQNSKAYDYIIKQLNASGSEKKMDIILDWWKTYMIVREKK